MKDNLVSLAERCGLKAAVAAGHYTPVPDSVPDPNEFEALVALVKPDGRMGKFYGFCIKHGKFWTILDEKGNYRELNVVNEKGKLIDAVPVWPKKEYAYYALDTDKADMDKNDNSVCSIDLVTWMDQVASSRKLAKQKVAIFWIPKLRTLCMSARLMAEELAEVWVYQTRKETFIP